MGFVQIRRCVNVVALAVGVPRALSGWHPKEFLADPSSPFPAGLVVLHDGEEKPSTGGAARRANNERRVKGVRCTIPGTTVDGGSKASFF